MLPLLAATLGITVDELLAGETRAEAAEEEPPAQAAPAGLTAARRQFAAEKLADADDKLLFAGLILLIGGLYLLSVIQLLGILPSVYPPFVGCVLLAAVCLWHRKTGSRLAALGADGTVSRRRRRLAAVVCGGAYGLPLLFLFLPFAFAGLPVGAADDSVLQRGRRIDLVLEDYHVITGEPSAAMYLWTLLPTILSIALILVFALVCRRMTAENRFRPISCAVLSVLPPVGAAAFIAAQYRCVCALAPEDYGVPLSAAWPEIQAGMQNITFIFRLGGGLAAALVIAGCVLRSRKGIRGLHGVAACAAVQYLAFALVCSADLLQTAGMEDPQLEYTRGLLTVYLQPLYMLLFVCLLGWAVCTLLSGLRRRQTPSAAPAEPPLAAQYIPAALRGRRLLPRRRSPRLSDRPKRRRGALLMRSAPSFVVSGSRPPDGQGDQYWLPFFLFWVFCCWFC